MTMDAIPSSMKLSDSTKKSKNMKKVLKFGGIEKYAIYPMMSVIKQEEMDEPPLPADSMQKVPSLSDLSDPDSGLDMPTQVLPLTPGTNKKMTDAVKASFANWEKEQIRLNFSKDPRQWTPDQVVHWICWTANEFSFQGVEIDKKLSVLGKDLCAMHREDFVDKAPPMLGDILWEHLEILQKGIVRRMVEGEREKMMRDAHFIFICNTHHAGRYPVGVRLSVAKFRPDIRDVTHTESNMVEPVES